MPPDIAQLILTKTPTLSRCCAACTCRALHQAARRVSPYDVEVPARAHPRSLYGNHRCWAAFIAWALRHSDTLHQLELREELRVAADVDLLFDWLARISALCPGLSSAASCTIRLHVMGSFASGIVAAVLSKIRHAPHVALRSLTSCDSAWVRSSSLSANDLLTVPHLTQLHVGIGHTPASPGHSLTRPSPLRILVMHIKPKMLTDPMITMLACLTTLTSLKLVAADGEDCNASAGILLASAFTRLEALRHLCVEQLPPCRFFSDWLCTSLALVLPRLTQLRSLSLGIIANDALLENLRLGTFLGSASVLLQLQSYTNDYATASTSLAAMKGLADQIARVSAIPFVRGLTLHVMCANSDAHLGAAVPTLTQIRSLRVLISGPACSRAWLTSLQRLTQLTKLEVNVEDVQEDSEDELEDVDDAPASSCTAPLCAALRPLVRLQVLSLSSCTAEFESARWLLASASCLTSLTHLHLNGWGGSPDDCVWGEALASSLPVLTRLRELRLERLPQPSGKAFAEHVVPALLPLTALTSVRFDQLPEGCSEALQALRPDLLSKGGD